MTLFEDLYGTYITEKKNVSCNKIPILPTLIGCYDGTSKLIFGKLESKQFNTVDEAELWAETNNIKIKIPHKTASFVLNNHTNGVEQLKTPK